MDKYINLPGKPDNIRVNILTDKNRIYCECCGKPYKAVYCIQSGTYASKFCDICFHKLLIKMYRKSKYVLDLSVNNVKTGAGK